MSSSGYQCLLCKKILSGQLDEHFSEHMKYHNVTHNQEFLFATFFLDVKGIEKTIEFMMNGGKERRDGTETSNVENFPNQENSTSDEALVTAVVADDDICIEVLQAEESFETKNDDDDAINNITVVDSMITTINADVVSDVKVIESKEEIEEVPALVKPRRGRPRKQKVVPRDVDDSNEPDFFYDKEASSLERTCNCGISFDSEKARTKHVNLYHSKFKCTECPLTFRNKFLLQDHILNPRDKHDPDYNSTECATCGETFETYVNLKAHKKSKHGIGNEKPCPICGEMIVNKKKHFRKCHFNLFECSICGKVVKNIVNHTLTVHGSEEDKRFKCHICGKGFILKDKLVSHLAIHSDARPYVCKFNCGFRSKTLGNLKKHESGKHTLNKTYPWNVKQEANDGSSNFIAEEKPVNNNCISVFNPPKEHNGNVVKTAGMRAKGFKLREVKDEFMSEEDMQDNKMSVIDSINQKNFESEMDSSSIMDLGDKTCIYMVDTQGDESKADRYIKIEPLSRHIFKSETLGMHQTPYKDLVGTNDGQVNKEEDEEEELEDQEVISNIKEDDDEERTLLEYMFNNSS